MAVETENVSQRLDKWLWAARFFKTRPLAVEAVNGGHVHVNNERTKPARNVRIGDELKITKGFETWVVTVQGCHEQRRPAAEAKLLYHEADYHRAQRELAIEERRLHGVNVKVHKPDKKERRLIEKFKQSW